MNALSYFSSTANGYAHRSEAIPWRWLRRSEAASVKRFLGDISGQNILELGCGAGYYTKCLLEMDAAHVTAVDFCEEMLKHLQCDSVAPVHSDATTYCGDLPFDGLFSAGLLEFVAEPQVLLENARKQVSGDGILVILLPEANFFGRIYRQFHRLHGFEIKLFSMDSIIVLAETAGWTYSCSRVVFPVSLGCKFTARL